MRLFSRVTAFVFALFFLVACGEEGEGPVTASSDPTPGQLSQALSDPLFVEASDMLAGDGLAVDSAAGHVITDDAGSWALEMPVVRLYTGGVVPYEAVVYEVVAGVGGVYFVEAADGGAFESPPEGAEPVASEEPRLGQASFNADVCGPWTAWAEIDRQCRLTTACPNRGLFSIQRRARTCRRPNGQHYRQFHNRTVLLRCGC